MAGHAYAVERDRHYNAIHTITRWSTQVFYEPGPTADARRVQALSLITQDPTRVPDHVFSGPELPVKRPSDDDFSERNREIPYSLVDILSRCYIDS